MMQNIDLNVAVLEKEDSTDDVTNCGMPCYSDSCYLCTPHGKIDLMEGEAFQNIWIYQTLGFYKELVVPRAHVREFRLMTPQQTAGFTERLVDITKRLTAGFTENLVEITKRLTADFNMEDIAYKLWELDSSSP